MDELKTPTMQQIAERAGVSRMAVSLALRNSPKVSVKTKEKIRAIAEELGYRPNPLVSALMTQLRHAKPPIRHATLAYVTAYPTRDGWRLPGPFVEFYEGARQRADLLGYDLEEWWLAEAGLTPQRFSEILYMRNIHGILLAPVPPEAAEMSMLWEKFAAVTIGYSIGGPGLHRASNHQYGSIGLALEELQKLGYRRIGLAIPDESDVRVKRQWSARMLVHHAHDASEKGVPPLLAGEDFCGEFSAWFQAHRPDAVLSLESDALSVMENLGVRVPEDVGFAHLAISPGDRDWAGINQNSDLVGAAAIDLIDGQLRRNERDLPTHPHTLLIPGEWVAGSTVRSQ